MNVYLCLITEIWVTIIGLRGFRGCENNQIVIWSGTHNRWLQLRLPTELLLGWEIRAQFMYRIDGGRGKCSKVERWKQPLSDSKWFLAMFLICCRVYWICSWGERRSGCVSNYGLCIPRCSEVWHFHLKFLPGISQIPQNDVWTSRIMAFIMPLPKETCAKLGSLIFCVRLSSLPRTRMKISIFYTWNPYTLRQFACHETLDFAILLLKSHRTLKI
jgi:hypothetical protein